MLVPSQANRLRKEGPSCSMDHDLLNHLVVLLRCPLLFVYVGVDVVEPLVPAALPRFEVLPLGLDEHLVADPFLLAFELPSFHNVGQDGKLFGAPSLTINVFATKSGDKLISEKLLVF